MASIQMVECTDRVDTTYSYKINIIFNRQIEKIKKMKKIIFIQKALSHYYVQNDIRIQEVWPYTSTKKSLMTKAKYT